MDIVSEMKLERFIGKKISIRTSLSKQVNSMQTYGGILRSIGELVIELDATGDGREGNKTVFVPRENVISAMVSNKD
jgi:hypothetical protein